MKLLLDIGNTRLKVAVAKKKKVEVISSVEHRGDWAAAIGRLGLPDGIDCIHVASVVGVENDAVLGEALEKKTGLKSVFHKVLPFFAGVHNGYREPSRLGVDRWLAIIAAFRRVQGAACVVDCGTTITIDLVTEEGRHSGGFILPGLAMAKSSLLHGTKAIDLSAEDHRLALSWGRSSEEAVCHGALFSAVASIERAWRVFQGEALDVTLILTGGDAPIIAKHLPRCELIPELVLEGILCSATLEA